MNQNFIRTENENFERKRLIEYNRQKKVETILTVFYFHSYIYFFLLIRFNQLIYLNHHIYHQMINHY